MSPSSLRGTKLIFVVGNAGTGKTTILSELTDLPGLVPGETLQQGEARHRLALSQFHVDLIFRL